MKTRLEFVAEKSPNGCSAGWNAAALVCNGSALGCIGALKSSNAALLSYIGVLWDYIISPPPNNAPLLAADSALYPGNVPSQDNSVALQENNPAASIFLAAMQSSIETMLSSFVALLAGGEPMESSAEAIRSSNARSSSPFFPTQNNPNPGGNYGIRQSNR